MALKANIVANFLGQGWRALMSLAFVPLYIKYLGIEAYGLIGIYAILQAWLGLLDMGMKPALGREMARFTGGAHDAQSIWDLLRSIEVISVLIGLFVAIGVWIASGWLAADWVQTERLSVSSIAQAFALMGMVTALQFVEGTYTSCIAGLQRQVLLNVVASLMATVRGLGAVGILLLVSPTINAFFVWQGMISLVTVSVFAWVVYHALPTPPYPARFSITALIGIWRYAAGVLAITLLSLLLTQVDKILLSRLLPLEAFAHYLLTMVVAGALYNVAAPITAAFYPRFAELAIGHGGDIKLSRDYHQSAQLVTVLMGSAAVVLMLFGDRVLLLWTADPALVRHVAPILTVLTLGTLLNGLMWIPYQMQLAHGWTALVIKVNCIAVAILIPAILWAVPIYGAPGAAWAWLTLNGGYLVFGIHFMHRRLLPAEKWRWYIQDVAIPATAAVIGAWMCRWLMPVNLGRLGEFIVLAITSGCVLLAAAVAAPLVRTELAQNLLGSNKEFHSKTAKLS